MSEALRRSHPALLGAIAGVAFGNVLLALNPHLLAPFPGLRLLAGGGLAGALLLAPFGFFVKEPGVPSSGFWGAAAFLLVLLGGFAESQRQAYYAYLGNGTRRVLVGVILAGAGSVLALLFAARSRPRGRSAVAFLLGPLALFMAVPLLGQRTPDRSPLAPPQAIPRTATRSLLVVGLEGVSWELLSRAASEGTLPVFARLLEEGAGGPLGTLAPHDRSALWTTAASGKLPRKHGVVSGGGSWTPFGILRLLPRVPGFKGPIHIPFSRPLPGSEPRSRSLAFWEVLAQRRHEAAVLGWPAAEPPREGLVFWATESFFSGGAAEGSAIPAEVAARARLLLLGPENLDRALSRALGPAALPEAERRRAAAAEGAARDLGIVGATLAAVPTGPGSVSALVLSGLAGPARAWGAAAEPRRYFGPPRRDAETAEKALLAYYRFLDDTLGDLLEREGRDRTLCVFSPSGFGPAPPFAALVDLLRGRAPTASPDAADDGFLVLWGSGIRSNVRLTSADVIDLAPTLLALAGEPIARDMDGRVLAEAFDERFTQGTSIPVVTTFEPEGPQ
ncbi:MAG TPA: alkaline phosphatase family protein [Thermoanaerobaculia bacterium]|nr:alkaline phosphatase family protein [Thermoanaerobaculia bacterium]